MAVMEYVTLGDHRVPVVAQRHARLRHKLSKDDFQKIMTMDYGTESYRVLSVLIPWMVQINQETGIPNLPLYEFEGYRSQEAMEAGDYQEEYDRSPTSEEIVLAFEKALMVGGASRLGKLMNLLQAGASLTSVQQTQTLSSPPTPGENGASISTDTGVPNPT